MDWSKLEAEIIKDINEAPVIAEKLKAFITGVKGSALEPLFEKLWPGLAAVEDKALADLDFLSSLDAKLITWLNVLFPKAG